MLESRAGDFPVLGYRPRLASRGLLVAVALVTVTIGFLILRGMAWLRAAASYSLFSISEF